jgi:hypothetical protein
VYEAISLGVGVVCYGAWCMYKANSALPYALTIEPVLFTVAFALIGGGQAC